MCQIREPVNNIRESLPQYGDVPSVYGSTMDFRIARTLAKSCGPLPSAWTAIPAVIVRRQHRRFPNCDQLDPSSGKAAAVGALFAGFHEVAHAVDIHTGAAEELIH